MPSFDQRIAVIAAKQMNVIRRVDVAAAGGTVEHIRSRLRRRLWRELHPGIYLHGSDEPSWLQAVLAASWAADELAATAETAAELYELDGASGRAEIQLVTAQTRRPVVRGAVVLRSRRPLVGVRTRHGLIRTVSVERCLIDYAAFVDTLSLERAVESALNKQLTAEARIWEALTLQGGRGVPGSGLLKSVMSGRPQGLPAKSVLEIHVGHILRDGGVDGLRRNHKVELPGEKFFLDYAHEGARVAIEADSREFHSTKTQKANDRTRQTRLEAAGWHFVRVSSDDAYRRPTWVVAEVKAAIRSRLRVVPSTEAVVAQHGRSSETGRGL